MYILNLYKSSIYILTQKKKNVMHYSFLSISQILCQSFIFSIEGSPPPSRKIKIMNCKQFAGKFPLNLNIIIASWITHNSLHWTLCSYSLFVIHVYTMHVLHEAYTVRPIDPFDWLYLIPGPCEAICSYALHTRVIHTDMCHVVWCNGWSHMLYRIVAK